MATVREKNGSVASPMVGGAEHVWKAGANGTMYEAKYEAKYDAALVAYSARRWPNKRGGSGRAFLSV